MSPHRHAISIAIIAVIAVLAAPASAERRKRDRAERNEAKDAPTLTAADEAPRLLRRGVDHYREGRYAEAVEAFRQSHALSPSAKVRVNLALALWKKGDAVAAAQELDRTLAGRDVAPAVVERARSLLADIGKELGRVEIEVRGTGPVWLDERRIGTAPLSDRVWVTPGMHEVRTATQRERVTAAAGEVTSARLDAVTLQAGASGTAGPVSSDDRTAAPARRRSRLWLVPAAATSVALGAGLGFALAARGDEQKLEDLNRASASHEYSEAASIKDRAEGRALFANISFAVAAVGAVAATWMLLDDSHSEGVELGFGGNYAYARGSF
jgi:tetratricopeptide (TPR) repeat protein